MEDAAFYLRCTGMSLLNEAGLCSGLRKCWRDFRSAFWLLVSYLMKPEEEKNVAGSRAIVNLGLFYCNSLLEL